MMVVKLTRKGEGFYEVDCRGYACPYPQLYTLKSLEKIKHWEMLKIIFDNPRSEETIKMVCDKRGDKILSLTKESGVLAIAIICCR